MIVYGYSVKEENDPFLPVVEAAMNGFSKSLEPGAFLVDMIPSRRSRFLRSLIAGGANHILIVNSPIRTRLVPRNGMESQS
jgi:hypothetical protein